MDERKTDNNAYRTFNLKCSLDDALIHPLRSNLALHLDVKQTPLLPAQTTAKCCTKIWQLKGGIYCAQNAEVMINILDLQLFQTVLNVYLNADAV